MGTSTLRCTTSTRTKAVGAPAAVHGAAFVPTGAARCVRHLRSARRPYGFFG